MLPVQISERWPQKSPRGDVTLRVALSRLTVKISVTFLPFILIYGMDIDPPGAAEAEEEQYEPQGPRPIRQLSQDVVNQIAAAEVSRQGRSVRLPGTYEVPPILSTCDDPR